MATREHYLIGRCGSYLVPTVLAVDAAITKLTGQIADADADHTQRERLWDDIDALLERRQTMTIDKAVTP